MESEPASLEAGFFVPLRVGARARAGITLYLIYEMDGPSFLDDMPACAWADIGQG
jgi:hypothetical protein